MEKQIIINIVSGKGGTGKTLLSAVWADMLGNNNYKVLVVDVDVFVRGLTALLYFHKGEVLRIIDKDKISMSDIICRYSQNNINNNEKDGELGISKYRSFDVLPAVALIDENLSMKDLFPDTKNEARHILNKFKKIIPTNYDFIILDSRAGYDELVSATHGISDISVCVEEDDNISRITTDNLITQLKSDSKTPLLRLVNKCRNKRDELISRDNRSSQISELGAIPFDADVMNSFGGEFFWDDIARSIYKESATRVWNLLSSKMDLKSELPLRRISPIGTSKLEGKIGFLTFRDRVFFIYGVLISIFGLGYAFADKDWIYILGKNPIQLVSLIIGFSGVALTLYTITRIGKK